VIEKLKAAGLRGDVKVIIGGAPTTQEWADEIGADGWAGDAVSAVSLVKQLVKV
jgi:methanogenic corrinoid protein MtbC1